MRNLVRRIFEVIDHPKNLALAFEGRTSKQYSFRYDKARGAHIFSVVVDPLGLFPGSVTEAKWKALKLDICQHNSRNFKLGFDAEIIQAEGSEGGGDSIEVRLERAEAALQKIVDFQPLPVEKPDRYQQLSEFAVETALEYLAPIPVPTEPEPTPEPKVEESSPERNANEEVAGRTLEVHQDIPETVEPAAGEAPAVVGAEADSELPPGSVVETEPEAESDLPPGSVAEPVAPEPTPEPAPEPPSTEPEAPSEPETPPALDINRKYTKKALLDLSIDQLKALAKERKIPGFSRAGEAKLVDKNLDWQKENL